MFQSSPAQVGRALVIVRPSTIAGPVSILARPSRTGALQPGHQPARAVIVSILARPSRTGAHREQAESLMRDLFQSSPAQVGRALSAAP